MKIPRDLSGQDLVKHLCKNWEDRMVHQEGSHVVLETETPSHQRIAVRAHKTLRIGTLNAILRAVARHKGVCGNNCSNRFETRQSYIDLTLGVLNVTGGLGASAFTLAEVYAHEAALARLHPGNLHVRDKIRQQLQVLGDLGFMKFLKVGGYEIILPWPEQGKTTLTKSI